MSGDLGSSTARNLGCRKDKRGRALTARNARRHRGVIGRLTDDFCVLEKVIALDENWRVKACKRDILVMG